MSIIPRVYGLHIKYSKRAPAILFALIFLIPSIRARAQISYRTEGEIARLQTVLPWHGPGAALLNPAHLGETGKVYGLGGIFSSISGKSGLKTYQLAGAMPMGLAAGLAGTQTSNSIGNSNAVYQENAFVPMLAYGWPADRDAGHRFSLGASMPVYVFNAFGAVKSTSASLDMGLLWVGNPAPDAGKFRIGIAVSRIIPPEIKLPDGRGDYSPKGETTLSLSWTSAGEMWEIHASSFAKEVETSEGSGDSEESTGLNTWGFKFLPVDWFAVKVERPRLGSLATYGLEFRTPPISEVQPSLEFNLGHDKGIPPYSPQWLWGEVQDEGRGFLMSGNIALRY